MFRSPKLVSMHDGFVHCFTHLDHTAIQCKAYYYHYYYYYYYYYYYKYEIIPDLSIFLSAIFVLW